MDYNSLSDDESGSKTTNNLLHTKELISLAPSQSESYKKSLVKSKKRRKKRTYHQSSTQIAPMEDSSGSFQLFPDYDTRARTLAFSRLTQFQHVDKIIKNIGTDKRKKPPFKKK